MSHVYDICILSSIIDTLHTLDTTTFVRGNFGGQLEATEAGGGYKINFFECCLDGYLINPCDKEMLILSIFYTFKAKNDAIDLYFELN